MTDDRDRDISREPTVIRKDGFKAAMKLGRYTLGKRLGIGGMAEVYLAEQDGPQHFKKRVVVKRILPALATDAQFVQMFVREAQVAARLSHANVVQIFELGEHTEEGRTEYFIAMEFIDGLTLQRLASASWEQGRALPLDVVLRAGADAARGLHAAHSLTDEGGRPTPLVHRDISPDNLMVSKDGVTKLLDFGIAKGDVGGPKTKTGNVRGKIPYMAPEQVTGQPLDGRSDIYSLGVAMYYLLCGERPFDRGTDYHTMQAALTEAPRSPRAINPQIPEALDALLLRMLAKNRDERPSSAADLADLLEELTQPGTGAGRKTMIAFVGNAIDHGLTTGNPLSEADGAHATKPAALEGAKLDGSALASAEAVASPAPVLSIEVRETVVPQQVPLPAGEEPPTAAETRAGAAPAAETPAAGEPISQQPTSQEPTSQEPVSLKPISGKPGARSGAAPTGVEGASHPVVDLLAPKHQGLPGWLGLLLVLGGMILVGGVGVVTAVWLLQRPPDATKAPPLAMDAGALVAAADAGLGPAGDAGLAVVAPPVDAGAVIAAADAGVVTAADAGVVTAVVAPAVDAGTLATVSTTTTDAGVEPQKPQRMAVRATAPARVRWSLPGGATVGRGSAVLSLPKGTGELVASEGSQSHTLAIALDAKSTLKGSVDYTPLMSATLVLTNVGDVRAMFGDDNISTSGPTRAVPGSYGVRLFQGDKRTIVKVTLKAGETTTLDVTKALKK